MLYQSTSLNIPFDMLNVQFIVPAVRPSSSRLIALKKATNSIRTHISTLRAKLKKYNETLMLTCLHLDTLGYRQLSTDLLTNKSEMHSKVDNVENIFEGLVSKNSRKFDMIPIAGDKTSLIRKAIEKTVGAKRLELSKSVFKKKKLVHLIIRIAAHSRPLIIDKQPEMGELVDLYDIWNDSKSSLRFR